MALGLEARLRMLCQETLPILIWGCAAWHPREDSIRIAEGRMTRLRIHVRELRKSTWLGWHVHARRKARSQLVQAWGAPPATIIVSSAVAVVKRLASRRIWSIVRRSVRRKLSADVESLREMAGSALEAPPRTPCQQNGKRPGVCRCFEQRLHIGRRLGLLVRPKTPDFGQLWSNFGRAWSDSGQIQPGSHAI